MSRPAHISPSQLAKIMCKMDVTKSKTAIGLADELVMRKLGVELDDFTTYAMEWGNTHEPEAREAYERKNFVEIPEKGRLVHPDYDYVSGEPDGLVGEDGLIEIKCPKSKWHLANLRNGFQVEKYNYQMQGYMWITGRAWCDFVSYDPRFPDDMKLAVKRIQRDNEIIEKIEERCQIFWNEMVLPKMNEFTVHTK